MQVIKIEVREDVYDLLNKASVLADVPISVMARNFLMAGLDETARACKEVALRESYPAPLCP